MYNTLCLFGAGPSLEEGVGRAGEVSCDLVSHDYLHIPGGMLDIGEEILAATGNVEVYTPTAEKFCGRSLSGLAIQEFAEKIKVNDPLGAQDNNTIATPVTSKRLLDLLFFIKHRKSVIYGQREDKFINIILLNYSTKN